MSANPICSIVPASRRGFLKRTLGACWTAASLLEQSVFRAAQARAQAARPTGAALPKLFDLEKVAPGVYAALARPAAVTNCNAAVFELEKELLIVDTHSKPSAAVTLLSQIRREITDKPVKYIVNSHFHWDHTQGTPSYKRIAPHADVISSEATRQLLAAEAPQRLKQSLAGVQKSIEEYKQKLAAATTAEEKQYYTTVAAEAKAYLAEMKNFTPEIPNVTLTADLVIHDKSGDLHLLFRGKAHTSGDISVFCPQKKVIATGDVLHGSTPFMGDGYPKDWPNTLVALAQLPFEHAIGGHHGVLHTKQRLHNMAAYIDELTDVVERGMRSGKPLERIQSETDPARLTALGTEGYANFLVEGIRKYRRVPPGTTPEQALAAGVRSNISQIHAALNRPL